ncbi:unnamed protein product [Absidia cylindrospora]
MMMTLRYVAIIIVVYVSLLTLQSISRTSPVAHGNSTAISDDSLLSNNSSSDSTLEKNVTTSLSSLKNMPWRCDCFYAGSSTPQLIRDAPLPSEPDHVDNGDRQPLIEPYDLTPPDDHIMDIIHRNMHWPRTLMLTVANDGMRHLVYNWIRSLERTQEDRFVVVCLDQALYDRLYKLGFGDHAFVLPDIWARYAFSNNNDDEQRRLISFTKTVVVQHILHLDISALYSDVDVIWQRPRTRDYMRQLMDLRDGRMTHVVFQPADVQQHRVNPGFFLMRPTPMMKRLVAETIYLQEEEERKTQWADQVQQRQASTAAEVALNDALSRMNLEIRSTYVVLLDVFLFPIGHSYFVKRYHDILGIDPYIVHANYYTGKEKVVKLKEYGLWHLDESWMD